MMNYALDVYGAEKDIALIYELLFDKNSRSPVGYSITLEGLLPSPKEFSSY